MPKNDKRYCKCGCKRELPDRYKGREKEFFNADCRKAYHGGYVNEYVLGL